MLAKYGEEKACETADLSACLFPAELGKQSPVAACLTVVVSMMDDLPINDSIEFLDLPIQCLDVFLLAHSDNA